MLISLAALVFLMVGVAYASVPLYNLFCKVTGFGGTTQVASSHKLPATGKDRLITVTFDGNVSPELPWEFKPERLNATVKVGQPLLVTYHAVNKGDQTVVGTATYNVQPDKAGAYFYKTQCFCFSQQVLKPGEKADLTVQFYVDASILDDPQMDDVQNITLSYTFFRAKDQSKASIQHSASGIQGDGISAQKAD